MRRSLAIVAALGAVATLGYGAARVLELEAAELEHRTPWQRLEPTADAEGRPTPHRELGRVELRRGEQVSFELCTRDQLAPERWADRIDLAVWIPDSQQVVVRQALDRSVIALATRSPEGSCVEFAQGSDLQQGGEYAIEAVWPERELADELARVPVQARITAFVPLARFDRWPAAVLLALVLLLVLALVTAPVEGSDAPDVATSRDPDALDDSGPSFAPTSGDVVRIGAGLALLVGAGVALAFVPFSGSFVGLVRGLVLATVQVVAAVLLVPRRGGSRRVALGLVPPRHGVWMLALAPLLGIGLWAVGLLPLWLIPATGVSPMGLLVAWPSGVLAVALASLAAPVFEEVFFRGFLFGTLERRWGGAAAFVVTGIIFAVLHLPQTWGAWGGLCAILITSIGLTGIRWWTGSIAVSVLAHLALNATIIL